jgi:hypothetical protein
MPSRCVAARCDSTVNTFQFPQNAELSAKWAAFVSERRTFDMSAYKDAHLCANHFEPGMFSNYHKHKMGFADRRVIINCVADL